MRNLTVNLPKFDFAHMVFLACGGSHQGVSHCVQTVSLSMFVAAHISNWFNGRYFCKTICEDNHAPTIHDVRFLESC